MNTRTSGGNPGSREPSQSSLSRPVGFDPGRKMTLPTRYSRLTPEEKRQARRQYAELQKGLCYHCKGSLDDDPPEKIQRLPINWNRFPPNFLRYPHHLHHSHDTGMTLGVVHARCNAVLWQYHGE